MKSTVHTSLRLFLVFLFLPFFAIAQFPMEMWTYDLGAPAFGSASAADMDGDGFYEIVFTTYTNDGQAHCLNAEDGSVRWTYNIGGCGDVAPLIADVDNDGALEVIINGSCNPTLFCIDGATGALEWSVYSGGGDSPPTVADIDQDGMPEILFGNFTGEIRIVNGEDGTLNKAIQADPNFGALQTEPTVVDVDADGDFEILAANFWNVSGLHVWAYDYLTGAAEWTNSVVDTSSDFHAYHGGALADLDNDGQLEYVIGSNNGDVRAINIEDGSNLWTAYAPGSNMSAVSVADLDDDGVLEVIFNNSDPVTFDNRIRILSGLDGLLEWSYPLVFTAFRGFSISDIDGNGQLDLASGHFMGDLRVVEPYSGLVWERNLRSDFVEPFPWFETDHQPLIADFDQNGTLDVFAVCGYGTYTPDSLNLGRAYMFEAGAGECPEWLMFRQDRNRTGYMSAAEIAASCDESTAIGPEAEQLVQPAVYPNPSGGAFTLIYSAELFQQFDRVRILDVLGREVYSFPPVKSKTGIVRQQFDLDLGQGTYFIHLGAEERSRIVPMVVR